MRFYPFERWVMLSEAPDLHQDTGAILKAVSYSRRKAEPNTGRWYRVHEVSEDCPKYLSHGAPVLANLSMLSDYINIGGESLALMPFSQCAALRINEDTMAAIHSRHPVIPVGDYVLCVDNDEKHAKILGKGTNEERIKAIMGDEYKPGLKPVEMPLMSLENGQRTDEQYDNDEDHERPNRPNDGVKMLFTEVAMVGPDVPLSRGLEPGDMVAFRPNVCGIKFDLFGVSYRLVRCPEKNSEIIGRVPRSEFE